jgi:predicted metal-dependent phosphotriesterase family hydrolase
VAVVETMRGPVDLGSLGQTLMHEHVFVLSTEHVQNYGSSWWDEETRVADAITKLNALPALLEAGVTPAQLDTMLVENPVRYFTPVKDGAA